MDEARNALAAVVPELKRYVSTGPMHSRHDIELYANPEGGMTSADDPRAQFSPMRSTGRERDFLAYLCLEMWSGLSMRRPGPISWTS